MIGQILLRLVYHKLDKRIDWPAERERVGTLGCLLHWSSKLNNNVFLFVGFKTLGTLIKFDWLVHKVHHFIGSCLIPLDPCVL